MKKLLALTLALLMTAALLPLDLRTAAAEDASGQCGENLFWSFDEETGTLTITGSGAMYDYNGSQPWESAPRPWDAFASAIETAVITDGATHIGNHAFADGFEQLSAVTIPSSVTSIGDCAFHRCTGLEELAIPYGVTSIGWEAFCGCTGLTELDIPDSVTAIDAGAFSECGLTSVRLSNGLTVINDGVFDSCFNLTSVLIPDGVTAIGSSAFGFCACLESVSIPESVTTIGNNAFDECSSLSEVFYGGTEEEKESIAIADGNEPLLDAIWHYRKIAGQCGDGLFWEVDTETGVLTITGSGDMWDFGPFASPWYSVRDEITTAAFPDEMTGIGENAFRNCTSLRSVTIPDSVTSIGENAFEYCTGLQSVTFGNGITGIGRNVFFSCTSLTEIVVPDGVTTINSYAFRNCTSLRSVTIPCSVNISSDAFVECTAITSVHLTEGTGTMSDAWLFWPWSTSPCEVVSVSMDEGIRNIGARAFYSCSNIREITIPSSVTTIGEYAFYDCTELQSITIPENVTTIGERAFKGCTGLAELTIPSGVTTVGDGSFSGCTGLTTLVFDDCAASIGASAFSGCTGIQSVTIPSSVTSIGEGAFAGCSGLTEITIPDGMTSIEWSVFECCTGLKEVTIPDSVTSIGESAFAGCSGLESITMPCSAEAELAFVFDCCDSVVSLHFTKGTGEWKVKNSMTAELFENNALTVTMDEGIRNIGEYALYNCKGLRSVTFPSSVTSIDRRAFSECTGLTEITLPTGLAGIGEEAFRNCTGLTEITLPTGLTDIGSRAFENCKKLKDVFYHGTRRMRNNLSVKGGNAYLTGAEWHYLPVNAIEWKTLPEKVTYQEGETLDLTGGAITTYYDYDIVEEEPLTGDMVSGFDGMTVGEQTLTVTFEGKTLTYEVTVSHVPGEPVHENEVEPTYTTEGSYDEVVYCTRCGAELERHTHTVDRLPLEATVEWNASDVQYKGKTAYVIYNGKAQTPRFTVKDADGNVIDPANYDYEYLENTNGGTAYLIVTFKGDYTGTAQGWFKIYLPATKWTKVENVAQGIRITWAPVEGAAGYVIYRRAWSTTTNGWTSFERWWNVTGTEWIDGSDPDHGVYAGTRYQYGVKAYFERRLDPVAGEEIGGNLNEPSGNYNLGIVGPLKTTVRITTRVLNAVEAGKKQMTVKWTPSGLFTGYEIEYATDANFHQAEMLRVDCRDANHQIIREKVITGLISGKTYCVRIRSYHEFEGFTYYGEWSNVLSCKVK